MKLFKLSAAALLLAGSALTLGACADGYGRDRGYSSVSIGVRSDGGHGYRDRDHDGVPNRYDRDKDGDGVPNRFDNAPNNPNYR